MKESERTLLEVEGVSVEFGRRSWPRPAPGLVAVDDVSFEVRAGETLAIVGESGSGKSTTARAVLGLVPLARGSVRLHGTELGELGRRDLRRARSAMQMVFQDPYSSLDPSTTVGASIAEPLRVHAGLSMSAAWPRVHELLELVGLRAGYADRYPAEFSGGQRQRIAIARALAVNPDLVVCDEAVSALDVSTQNQIVNLLADLRETLDLAYLFIAHDLAVVRHIADRVAVMYRGRIVEIGSVERVYTDPLHPYTRSLLASVPVPDPRRRHGRVRAAPPGEPAAARTAPGCTYAPRCPLVTEACSVMPSLEPASSGAEVACHAQPRVPKAVPG